MSENRAQQLLARRKGQIAHIHLEARLRARCVRLQLGHVDANLSFKKRLAIHRERLLGFRCGGTQFRVSASQTRTRAHAV